MFQLENVKGIVTMYNISKKVDVSKITQFKMVFLFEIRGNCGHLLRHLPRSRPSYIK